MRYAIMLLVALQVFYALPTILALRVGGGEERNPVMTMTLEQAGGAGLFVANPLAVVFLAIAIDSLEKPYVKLAIVIMNVVYAIVLSGNFMAYGLATDNGALPAAFWALICGFGAVALGEVFVKLKHRL
jgi:hypothetical protein